MTAVIIQDMAFRSAEIFSYGALATHISHEEMPQFFEKFEEFKAYQLFKGYGPFEDIDQAIRFAVIDSLLDVVNHFKLPIVYGAVNKAKLRNEFLGSANPVDVCFRVCMRGVNEYATNNGNFRELAVLIADESNKDKKVIRNSFYDFRQRIAAGKLLVCLHDDMYFGESKYSVGIQLADLCGYFIAKHLQQDSCTAAQAFTARSRTGSFSRRCNQRTKKIRHINPIFTKPSRG